jgi:hypothetical protein
VGLIRWPLRLHEDAADYDYVNDEIQTALYEAYSSVHDILTRRMQHPIMELFSKHMVQQRKKRTTDNPHYDPTNNNLLEDASKFPFLVPILPGDSSLAIDFISSLKYHIAQLPATVIDDCAIIVIGQALFNLVILRTYLSRPAENDLDIFELVNNRQVSRTWTNHEQALAACFGEEDTSIDAKFHTKPSPTLWGIKVEIDSELCVPGGSPLVVIQQPVIWTERPGLTGGILKPRRYRPPYLRSLIPGPRPTPKPAYGTKASDVTNTVSLIKTAPTAKISPKRKRAVDGFGDVEMPTTKRKDPASNPLASAAGVEEDAGPSGTPAKLRRGTRKRTALKF